MAVEVTEASLLRASKAVLGGAGVSIFNLNIRTALRAVIFLVVEQMKEHEHPERIVIPINFKGIPAEGANSNNLTYRGFACLQYIKDHRDDFDFATLDNGSTPHPYYIVKGRKIYINGITVDKYIDAFTFKMPEQPMRLPTLRTTFPRAAPEKREYKLEHPKFSLRDSNLKEVATMWSDITPNIKFSEKTTEHDFLVSFLRIHLSILLRDYMNDNARIYKARVEHEGVRYFREEWDAIKRIVNGEKFKILIPKLKFVDVFGHGYDTKLADPHEMIISFFMELNKVPREEAEKSIEKLDSMTTRGWLDAIDCTFPNFRAIPVSLKEDHIQIRFDDETLVTLQDDSFRVMNVINELSDNNYHRVIFTQECVDDIREEMHDLNKDIDAIKCDIDKISTEIKTIIQKFNGQFEKGQEYNEWRIAEFLEDLEFPEGYEDSDHFREKMNERRRLIVKCDYYNEKFDILSLILPTIRVEDAAVKK